MTLSVSHLSLLIFGMAAALPLGACADGYGREPAYVSDDNSYYLSDNDYIYRDEYGNYYCKRRDGTTGTIVGGLAGGVLGDIIAPRGSKTLGAILGAGAGAVIGNQIERNKVRCS